MAGQCIHHDVDCPWLELDVKIIAEKFVASLML
jgi:hypothetical protein